MEENNVNTYNNNINFRKTNKRRFFKGFFRIISLVLVSAISGGAGAAYIINKNDSKSYNYSENNKNIFQNTSGKTSNIPTNAINKVAELVGPAVVGISNNVSSFGDQEVTTGKGSGIIFRADGYIVTNYHVISGAQSVTVKLASGKILDAKLIGSDPLGDLAVIKVDAVNLPVATFADSSTVRVGDLAVAIGNPLGEFEGSVTSGIVSALNRRVDMTDADTNQTTFYRVMQTDAAINPGNSGGALCNENGEIIGINSLKAGGSSDTSVEGIGFSIPINDAKKSIDSIMKYGKVKRPYLGIAGRTAVKSDTGSEEITGVYVQKAMANTGAADAGIMPGDVITEMDNVKIKEFDDLKDIIDKHSVGESVLCKVWRNGKTINIKIQLVEAPVTNQ